MKMDIKVKKRDSKLEDYESEKIGRVVIACGLEAKEAEKLVAEIDEWAKQFEGQTITSHQIRDKIIEIMPKYSEYSAKQYTWWEKYKDKYNIT
jgi:2-phosphoglycerate kinase